MDNNDILIRLRYALDIKDSEMVKIFELGGKKVSVEEVQKLLVKTKEESYHNEDDYNSYIRDVEEKLICDNSMLDSFLNGLITHIRGKQEPKEGQADKPDITINDRNVNNILLKRVKIALSLTSEDMLDIFEKAGITITKGELSAVLRREGQRNYKECGDRYARNFLKGLAIRFR